MTVYLIALLCGLAAPSSLVRRTRRAERL